VGVPLAIIFEGQILIWVMGIALLMSVMSFKQ
jgi:hypothetical protein